MSSAWEELCCVEELKKDQILFESNLGVLWTFGKLVEEDFRIFKLRLREFELCI